MTVTVKDGIAWVTRPDGDEWTATPGECAQEIARLSQELTLAYAEVRKQVAGSHVVFDRALCERARKAVEE